MVLPLIDALLYKQKKYFKKTKMLLDRAKHISSFESCLDPGVYSSTVYLESIHSTSLVPHCVMLQPYSKIPPSSVNGRSLGPPGLFLELTAWPI